MTLLDRVRECNAYDPARYVPWLVVSRTAGWVRRELAPVLGEFADVFAVTDDSVRLAPALESASGEAGFAARTDAVAEVCEALADRGLVRRLGHELYPIAPHFGAQPWLAMQRAALPSFGARAHGVHMHGLVRRGEQRLLWIARRSATKTTFPGMLDNMVAGGQPIGLGVHENLVKECAEEAAIPADLAARAVPTGLVTYKVESEWGLRNDVLFLFELELPDDFLPANTDGEVESFELWPVDRVRDVVANTRRFKFNCNLAIIDFLIRHGDVGPDDPEYVELVSGLRR